MLYSNIKIKVSGKNINNFMKKIIKEKINVISLKQISYNCVELVISYSDYLKLRKRKSIYKIEILEKYGKLKLKEILKKNKYIFLFLGISLILLYILSNIVFKIEVIHNDKDIKELIYNELNNNNLKKYMFVKKYEELEKIEDRILKSNKDKLEWIEITRVGTSYVVRVEERKIITKEKKDKYQNIVSSKNAVITKIIANQGEKVARIGSYVNRGSVIISGNITLPDGSSSLVSAKGYVEGEVWYVVNIEYPYIYKEEILTGKTKDVYVINFINKRISLFDFDKYNSFQTSPKILLQSNLIPLSFVKEKQYEIEVIDEAYTEEQIIVKAKDLAKQKLYKQNNNIVDINEIKVMSTSNLESRMKIKFFISVTENITMEEEILEEEKEIGKEAN